MTLDLAARPRTLRDVVQTMGWNREAIAAVVSGAGPDQPTLFTGPHSPVGPLSAQRVRETLSRSAHQRIKSPTTLGRVARRLSRRLWP
jgi:hypothetical protein